MAKKISPEKQEIRKTKDYFDCIAPSTIKFMNNYYMEVSQEFYKEYYRDRRRERYLDELEAMNVISFHSLDTEEFCGEEILIDHSEDVAEQVAHKMMIEKLTAVLPLLTDDERELIQAIYFDEMTEREYAEKTGVYRNAVHKRKVRILEKLKKLLEN